MLAYVLKEQRKKLGLTQAQIADVLKIPRGTYVHYELGKREPDNEMLKNIATCFNVSIDYLLGYEQEPKGIIDINPITGKNMTSLEKKQLSDVLENAHALFFDEEISDRDKETFLRSITDAFWEAKEMNRRTKE